MTHLLTVTPGRDLRGQYWPWSWRHSTQGEKNKSWNRFGNGTAWRSTSQWGALKRHPNMTELKMNFSQSSSWCNAMDIQETDEVGLKCTVLPEGKDFRDLVYLGSLWIYWAIMKTGVHITGVSLPLSPQWPELRKQHDFESCWVLTLPEDARCSCILQLFTFIYNAWPRVQDSSLRVHKHMHNLEEIPWKQTTSQSTTSGEMCFVRKSCWRQNSWKQDFQLFVKKKKKNRNLRFKCKFPPDIQHRNKDIESRGITIRANLVFTN